MKLGGFLLLTLTLPHLSLALNLPDISGFFASLTGGSHSEAGEEIKVENLEHGERAKRRTRIGDENSAHPFEVVSSV